MEMTTLHPCPRPPPRPPLPRAGPRHPNPVAARPAGAVDKRWVGAADGVWHASADRSPAEVPGMAVFVEVTAAPSVDALSYANPAGASVVPEYLTIDLAFVQRSH